MHSSKIKQIKYLGTLPTVDIEINHPSHLYYANNIATSNSHSYQYGIRGYCGAYMKLHAPVEFFTAFIHWAKEKMDKEAEMSDLVMEAKLFDIDVVPPLFEDMKKGPYHKDRLVFMGLTEIKNVGSKIVDGIKKDLEDNNIDLKSLTIDELIIYSQLFAGESVLEKLAACGALRNFSKERKKTIDKIIKFNMLSKGEQKWCLNFIKENKHLNLLQVLKECAKPKKLGGGCNGDKHVQKVLSIINNLENPSSPMDDTPFFIYNSELNAFGVPLTISKVDAVSKYDVTQKCADFINTKEKEFVLNTEILDTRIIKVKRGKSAGKNMAYMSLSDGTAKLDSCTLFADTYEKYSHLVEQGNVVVVKGYRDTKQGGNQFIIQEIFKGE